MTLHKMRHIIQVASKRLLLSMGGLFLLAGGVLGQTPNPPSDVRLKVVRDNAIDVLWQDNSSNEAAFDVFRRSGAGAYTLLGAVDANITVFQDRNSGIRPNLEFCYRVAARNGSGSSLRSDEACITVPPRPNAPSNLELSRDDGSSPLDLLWTDNSNNETKFLIYRNTDGVAFVLYDTANVNVTTSSDFYLREVGDYCYFVSAINESGESAGTDVTCLNVAADPAIPPTDLSAESVSADEIRLQWQYGVINHATLFLERSDDDQTTWTDVFQTTTLDLEHVDVSLSPNTEYCYRIRVENGSAVPGFSNVDCASTAFAVPDAPTGLNAVGLPGKSITVSWQPVVSAGIRYRIDHRASDLDFELEADSLEDVSYTDSALDPDLVHCYRVRAFNPQHDSDWSETVCAIVPPDPVASLSAAPSPVDPIRRLTVSWEPGSDVSATSFLVRYRESGQGAFSSPTAVTANEITIFDLADATLYEISVTARRVIDESSAESSSVETTARTLLSFWPGDANGDGTVSAEDVVTLTAPACFGGVTGFSTDGRNVAWAEIAVDMAELEPSVIRCDTDRTGSINIFDFLAIAANAGRATGKGSGPMPATVVDDAHLARISAIFESFEPNAENAEQKRLKEDLGRILKKGVAELPDLVALSAVYPNPTLSQFSSTIDLPESAPVSVTLMNTAGQVVRRETDNTMTAGRHTLTFDVGTFAPGLYFVVVEVDGKRISRPVTIVR